MIHKIHSPTSILTYLYCPRKYYYRYIVKAVPRSNTALLCGSVAHQVLSAFFNEDLQECFQADTPSLDLMEARVLNLLHKKWGERRNEFEVLNISDEQITAHYEAVKDMVMSWVHHVHRELLETLVYLPQSCAIRRCIPEREVRLVSQRLQIMGNIDAIYRYPEGITIIDYKTSKQPLLDEKARLQLGIYALLCVDAYGEKPRRVGIHFLPAGIIKSIDVDESLLNTAQLECELIQLKTISEDIEDYPCTCGGYCKNDFIFPKHV